MGFSNQERINLNSKVLAASVIDANENAQWYESRFFNEFVLDARKVWIEFDLLRQYPAANLATAQANAAGPLNNQIEDLSQDINAVQLTLIPGSNNSTLTAYQTFNDFTSDRVDNWIQPQAIPQSNGTASIGYAIRLFEGKPGNPGSREILTSEGQTGSGSTASPAWIWNYGLGTLFLSADYRASLDLNDLWVKGFRYIGLTALDGYTDGYDGYAPFQEAISVDVNDKRIFDLSFAPSSASTVLFFNNGQKIAIADYLVVGTTVTYSPPINQEINIGDIVEFYYFIPGGSLTTPAFGGSQNLATTLLFGNKTSGNDIELTGADGITSNSSLITLKDNVSALSMSLISQSSRPSVSLSGRGLVWVDDSNPTILKFTDSDGTDFNLNSYFEEFQGTTTTTDATPTTIATVSLPIDGYVMNVNMLANAIDVSADEAGVWSLKAGFKNVGGIVSQIGDTALMNDDLENANWDVDFSISGTDINVIVTGALGSAINWRVIGYLARSG